MVAVYKLIGPMGLMSLIRPNRLMMITDKPNEADEPDAPKGNGLLTFHFYLLPFNLDLWRYTAR